MPRRPPGGDVEITGIASDSREVRPGFLFAALPGLATDGRYFVADAVARGAAAILVPEAIDLGAAEGRVRTVVDPNPRGRLAEISARFYPDPPERCVAVTGTNGKTSVVSFARQIWGATGLRAAAVGTLGVVGPSGKRAGSLTTPDPVTLHRDLAALADAGVERAALEASSHGLAQCRLDGVPLAAAGFTNLSRDHLDYHVSFDAYRAAKLRLFGELLPPGGTAVLNADSPEFDLFAETCRARGCPVIDYGRNAQELRLVSVEPETDGQVAELVAFGVTRRQRFGLIGEFQVGNALCAAGLVVGGGDDPCAAIDSLGTLEAPPGRMQPVGRSPTGAAIFVDYAHTPVALAHALQALRLHAAGALVVVFGCGGDRDSGKRRLMGETAARFADRVVVTDDNPRNEDAGAIRREVLSGCPDAVEIGHRGEAIRAAIAGLAADDVLIVAGKGDETGQIVGNTTRPFDDVETAREALRALGGVRA